MKKAIAAALSAIEVYNKPSFEYRDETFSILMINAWELMLKVRILQQNDNKLKSILHVEPKIKKDNVASIPETLQLRR
jgi:hypothetical protein